MSMAVKDQGTEPSHESDLATVHQLSHVKSRRVCTELETGRRGGRVSAA